MKINDEYVGTMTKQFIEDHRKPNLRYACKWLDQHRELWVKKYSSFDYPIYCGLPDHISKLLMPDEVDYLQSIIDPSDYL